MVKISNIEELFVKKKEPECKINDDGITPKPIIRKEENPKNIEIQINKLIKKRD